ncbi:hypothetical protein OEZ86_010048 [Tetradesmus obliquus]|uniref:Uncharacterized protein n=1 Tax=Tetradesmus obliquus TaxID=3088 RepID=A0ABY8UPV2_TETOB|nr:hypothetical protein OEZ85_001483 [Tetradesmus obliquus]WIA43602.1 hypothetical protein OEZ86_010048 [Tetradesmus obliquus]
MSASVLSRKSVKEQIKSKGKALSWVRKRVEKLQEENERLAYQHQLVAEQQPWQASACVPDKHGNRGAAGRA